MNMQLIDRFGNKMPRVSPFKESGVSGTAVFGGYIVSKERTGRLQGMQRHVTAADILTNVSVVAAGVRYFLNLLAKPKWQVDNDDDDKSTELKEFVEEVMEDMETAWARVIRRAGLYRFHGFGIQEWVAKKRPDGKIGFKDIESRPQHSIERWSVDDKGTVTGVWQRSPQDGRELPLPREKIIYLVDDTLTDAPDGMGWFRHLVEPSDRLKTYLQLEGYGFQRDLSGTPIGRAPLTKLNEMVRANQISPEDADGMITGMRNFVKMQAKNPDTGLLLDSATYESATADGPAVSSVAQWGLELLTGETSSLDKVDNAIMRVTYDMARIIGVESLLVGSDSVGSLALSKDKSNNLYLQVQSTLHDMATTFTKDYIDPLWMLNGFPDEQKPKFRTEDVAFKDIQQISSMLRDMATAGVPMQPDDPAINDMRDLAGISHAPEMDPEMMGLLRDEAAIRAAQGLRPGDMPTDEEELEEEEADAKKKPPPKRPARKRPSSSKED